MGFLWNKSIKTRNISSVKCYLSIHTNINRGGDVGVNNGFPHRSIHPGLFNPYWIANVDKKYQRLERMNCNSSGFILFIWQQNSNTFKFFVFSLIKSFNIDIISRFIIPKHQSVVGINFNFIRIELIVNVFKSSL